MAMLTALDVLYITGFGLVFFTKSIHIICFYFRLISFASFVKIFKMVFFFLHVIIDFVIFLYFFLLLYIYFTYYIVCSLNIFIYLNY